MSQLEKASEGIEPEEVKVREVTFSSPKKQPPADSGDYPTLKKYWNEAANENPEEISPTKKIISRNGVESSSSDAYAEAAKKLAEEEEAAWVADLAEARAAREVMEAEDERVAAEEQRLAEEKAEKEKIIAAEKAAMENKLAEEKAANEKSLADEKAAKEQKLAEEKNATEQAEEQARLKAEVKAAVEAEKELVAANAVEAAKASTKNEEPQVAVAEESQTPWEPGMVTCSVCAAAKAKSEYSKVQLKKKTFKCKECVAKQTS